MQIGFALRNNLLQRSSFALVKVFTMPLRILNLLPRFLCLLAFTGAIAAQAEDIVVSNPPTFSVTSWTARYEGQIAGKNVKVELSRLGDWVSGQYCYQPCSPQIGRIELSGQITGQLTETPFDLANLAKGRSAPKPSGRWQLGALPGVAPQQLGGQWSSMDGKRRWPIQLQRKPDAWPHEAEAELHLSANRYIRTAKDCAADSEPLQISAIRIYEQGRLRQTLDTAAYGSCSIVQPQWVDANFDGLPDLSQSLELPAGPNIRHSTWLFNAASKRWELGPEVLQQISSPVFDARAKRIYSPWRDGCCSHGVDIYAWQQEKLKKVEQGQSYVLPVRKAGKLMGCYIMPSYGDGHIVWPDALYRNADGLSLGKSPADDWCDVSVASSMHMAQLQVLAPQPAGREASVLAAYGMSYAQVDTAEGKRFCPDLMVFDADARKLVRMKLDQDAANTCSAERP